MTLPSLVPVAIIRRVSSGEGERPVVLQVAPPVVPAPHVVPRQIDPVGLRLMALQLENEELRAELEQLRAG